MSSQKQWAEMKKNAVISVVDDDESVRTSLKRLLRSLGFDVRTFPSAMEFLNQGPLHGHGCVIMDVRMPEVDGLDLQKRLSDSDVPLPVIFITAYEDHGARTRAMEAGAVAFLQKPFSDPFLIDAISLALERSSQQRSDRAGTSDRGKRVPIQAFEQKG